MFTTKRYCALVDASGRALLVLALMMSGKRTQAFHASVSHQLEDLSSQSAGILPRMRFIVASIGGGSLLDWIGAFRNVADWEIEG